MYADLLEVDLMYIFNYLIISCVNVIMMALWDSFIRDCIHVVRLMNL